MPWTQATLIAAALCLGAGACTQEASSTYSGRVADDAPPRVAVRTQDAGRMTDASFARARASRGAAAALVGVQQSDDPQASIIGAASMLGGDDLRVVSLVRQLESACEARASSAPGAAPVDAGRDWARAELARRCATFDSRALDAIIQPSRTVYDEWIDRGKGAAQLRAAQDLRTATDAVTLAAAAQTLKQLGALPEDAMAVTDRRLDEQAQGTALRLAAVLRECDAYGCGPRSFSTIAFCAHFGCRQGADIHQAMREALPPLQYQATVRAHRWMQGQYRR